jgi:hypothetical protein
MARTCSIHREKKNAHMISVRKPEGKRPLGRTRRKWEDNKTDLREIRWGSKDWIDLARIEANGGHGIS